MDHHLYLAAQASEFAQVQRQFRDCLSPWPETARRYAILKQSLAAAFPMDRDAYTEAKGPFVREVLAAARSDAIEPKGAGVDTDLSGSPTTYVVFSSAGIRIGTRFASISRNPCLRRWESGSAKPFIARPPSFW